MICTLPLDAALLENESRRPLSNFRRPRANMMNIFESEETLNIFQPEGLKPDGPEPNQLETWNKCSERANKIILTQPPRNMLEDMVQMTEKGMLWHFPIDNEQGVNEKMVSTIHTYVKTSIIRAQIFTSLMVDLRRVGDVMGHFLAI